MGASLNFRNPVKYISVDSDLSMTYGNTQAFLAVLGFNVETQLVNVLGYDMPVFESFTGALPEFIAALERFKNSDIASVVDGGTPTIENGNVISFGRSENYFSRRVDCALQMAREASDKGATEFYFC